MHLRSLASLVALAAALAACGGPAEVAGGRATATTPEPSATASTTPPSAPGTPEPTPPATAGDADEPAEVPVPRSGATAAPAWLGTRELPRRDDGFGEVQPTPPELDPRRIATLDRLPPPADGAFAATIDPVPDDVLARSTWQEGCPVTRDELAYVTVSFVGFDGAAHTGELLVHRDVADTVVGVFRDAFAARFPIEEMRIVHPDELDLAPTGDGNNTTSFVCRPVRGRTRWSQHAYGTAVDVNPFHNPYVKADLVLPELASTYVDRTDVRDGMVVDGGPVVSAFDAAGWGWGGRWSSLLDHMHFSLDGT